MTRIVVKYALIDNSGGGTYITDAKTLRDAEIELRAKYGNRLFSAALITNSITSKDKLSSLAHLI